MESTDSANDKSMDGEKWADVMEKEQRDRRSRSPLDKKPNRSRESSTNRNSRQSRNNRSRSPRGRRTRAPTNRRIYVANIPYDCKWTTVKDLFREKVGDVSYVELFEDEHGKFRGCGIVEFKDSLSVQKAVDILHRHEFKGRQLVVKEDFDVDRDKTGKPLGRMRGGGGGGSGGGGTGVGGGGHALLDRERDDYGGLGGLSGLGNNNTPQYNTYGLSPQFLDALRITGPLTNRVFVANLDYKVTTQKLEEVFKLAGRVVKIDLKRNEEGNSKGHGTIEMGHPVEAVQAISMFNGQKFYNRTMSVRMDKKHQDDPEDKRLPEGLQSVGKGLGANGLPLHLSNSSAVNNLTPGGMTPVGGLGGVGANTLGLMSPQLPSAVVGGSATGIPGLSGIGMGLQERNFSSLGASGVGVGGVGQGLGLGSTGTAGLGNPSLLSGGLSGMSSSAAGLGAGGLGGGLGSSLTGGLGLGLGGSSVGAGSGLGYNDYDRSFDREDSYRNNHSSDTVIVRNLPVTCTWENVRDRFRDFGDVQSTDMKGRGIALIRFSSERDAARAVDRMRGSRIFGRLLDVSLY